MNKVTVLIAHGANSVSIPCRFFADVETGLARCKEILGVEPEKETTLTGDPKYTFDIDLEKAPEAISSELFTRHYYGCGGVYGLTLKEVSFDVKFLGFDLD